MKLIEKFNTALLELYNHVGFTPDFVVYPIDDCTECYWSEDGNYVRYVEKLEDYNNHEYGWKDQIYTHRFYDKWVYRGKDLTMIFCDPKVDFAKWFRVFDNSKEVKV